MVVPRPGNNKRMGQNRPGNSNNARRFKSGNHPNRRMNVGMGAMFNANQIPSNGYLDFTEPTNQGNNLNMNQQKAFKNANNSNNGVGAGGGGGGGGAGNGTNVNANGNSGNNKNRGGQRRGNNGQRGQGANNGNGNSNDGNNRWGHNNRGRDQSMNNNRNNNMNNNMRQGMMHGGQFGGPMSRMHPMGPMAMPPMGMLPPPLPPPLPMQHMNGRFGPPRPLMPPPMGGPIGPGMMRRPPNFRMGPGPFANRGMMPRNGTGGGPIRRNNKAGAGGMVTKNVRRGSQKNRKKGQVKNGKQANQNVNKYALDKPWVNDEIKEAHKIKTDLENQLKGKKNDEIFAKFKEQRDKFVSLYDAAKVAYLAAQKEDKEKVLKESDTGEQNDTNNDVEMPNASAAS